MAAWWFWSCCCAEGVNEGKASFVSLTPAQDPFSEGCRQVHRTMSPSDQEPLQQVFRVNLDKGSNEIPLGLHLDLSDGKVLHVCSIRPGNNPVTRHNSVVAKENQILPGDYIKAVNGISNSATALAEAVMQRTTLQLVVQRPYCFSMRIDRAHEPMGLDLNYSEKGTSLVITDIGPGAVRRRAKHVLVGDRILTVNGLAGTPEQLLMYIKNANAVELGMSRCLL
mmetsp:Transcript_64551/g.185647  ORF Transcript_64551/g.185647 Transcript_64551/m.185647 type:complete len:224 (-) Transcript_64551:71-742(-)